MGWTKVQYQGCEYLVSDSPLPIVAVERRYGGDGYHGWIGTPADVPYDHNGQSVEHDELWFDYGGVYGEGDTPDQAEMGLMFKVIRLSNDWVRYSGGLSDGR